MRTLIMRIEDDCAGDNPGVCSAEKRFVVNDLLRYNASTRDIILSESFYILQQDVSESVCNRMRGIATPAQATDPGRA